MVAAIDKDLVGHFDNKHVSAGRLARLLLRRYYSTVTSFVTTDTQTLLDAGCGEGDMLETILSVRSGLIATVCDHSAAMVQETSRRTGAIGVVCDLSSLPFEDGQFDVVLCLQTLEHVLCPGDVLDELLRVARRSVVISVPHEPFWCALNFLRGRYISSWGNTPGHIHHWSYRRLAHFLREKRQSFTLSMTAPPFLVGRIDKPLSL